MSEPDLVSIVMPVFNAEMHIADAIRSLKEQEYKTFEAIIINDGSDDNSLGIIHELVAHDDRFIVMNTSNHGQAAARSKGIKVANGKYLAFMDSDDFASKTWIQTMVQDMIEQNVEMVCVNYAEFYEERKQFVHQEYLPEFLKIDRESAYIEWCKDKRLKGFLWNKLFLADAVKKNNTKINFSFMEDSYLVLKVIKDVHGIYLDNRVEYYYRYDDNSAVNAPFKLSDLQTFETFKTYLKKLEKNYPKLHSIFSMRLLKIELLIISKMSRKQYYENSAFINDFRGRLKSDQINTSILFNKVDVVLLSMMRKTKKTYFFIRVRSLLVIILRKLRQLRRGGKR